MLLTPPSGTPGRFGKGYNGASPIRPDSEGKLRYAANRPMDRLWGYSMAHDALAPGSQDTRDSARRGTGNPITGEVAIEQATDLYVEQERINRRERFERMIRKAARAFQ